MADSSNRASSSTIMVPSGYYDPVDIESKGLKKGSIITQESKVIRMSPEYTGYYGFGRWDGKIKSHTGYDYIAPNGTPIQAVQFGYIERIRFGRTPIKYYFEKKDDTHYYKKKWFSCPFFELLKKGTSFFDQNTCKECQSKYFIYYEITPNKGYKDWKTYQIISERINGPIIDVSTTDISERTANKQIIWRRISADCFGVQLWLKIRNYVTHDSGYYAYYAHLSELNADILLSVINSKFNLFKSKKECEGVTTIILDKPIQVDAGDIIGKSGCTGNALNMVGDDQHLHFECRTGTGEQYSQVSPNIIVKTEFNIKYTKYNKIPSSYKEFVQEFTEKIEKKDIIEYRASEKWLKGAKKGYNLEYINMIKEQEKAKDPRLTDDYFDKNIKPKILIEKKSTWKKWFEYKKHKISEEEPQWEIIKKDSASKDALVAYKKEHVLVVGTVKGTEKNTKEVAINP